MALTGWNMLRQSNGDDGYNDVTPGIFDSSGMFRWTDGSGRQEQSVLVADPDGSLRNQGFVGDSQADGNYARVPLSIAQQNNLQIVRPASPDPQYDKGSFLDNLITNYGPGIIASMAIPGVGSSIFNAPGQASALSQLFGAVPPMPAAPAIPTAAATSAGGQALGSGLTMKGTGGLATMGGGQGLTTAAGTSALTGGLENAGAATAGASGGSALGSFLGGTGALGAGVAASGAGFGLPSAMGTGLSSFLNGAGQAAAGALGSYSVPWDKIIGGLGEYIGANNYADKMAEAMKYAVDKADPFSSQRPQYQAQLPGLEQRQLGLLDLFKDRYSNLSATGDRMFTDPNYWNNDSVLAGLNKNTINDTSRELASRGYNMSGNEGMEIAKRIQNNNGQYVPQFQNAFTNYANSNMAGLNSVVSANGNNLNQIGGFSGAGFGPGQAGTVAGTMGTAQAAASQQGAGALGSIFQSVYNGAQPNGAQQVLGMAKNQNLNQYLFS